MPSLAVPLRRRRQPASELSDDDNDYGSDASSSKRSRVSGNHSGFNSSSPAPVQHSRQQYRGQKSTARADANSPFNPDEHQPGAIVRVAVTNFVTYENAVFYPGPNLNMVIGPNGTGKSSLVCAICLGLGYHPRHLGRAGQVGEFVKHGNDSATIEIELKGRPNENRNHVVRARIIKDGDKRKWWINDSETSLKSVQLLMKSFGIQVDNLCQFLPQDRVAEFAGLSPVDLLHETQRAAAPPEMLAWHDQLKALRVEEKTLQLQHSGDKDTMSNLEERQENLRGDVERLQERAQIEEKIVLLEKTVPFVEYRVARDNHNERRDQLKAAQAKLASLEREVEPTMRAVNQKQQYQRTIETVISERRKVVLDCEKAADRAITSMEALEDKIKALEQNKIAEYESDKSRKQEMASIRRKISDLKAQLQNVPPEFDAAAWNTQIRAKEHRVRQIDSDLRELSTEEVELKRRAQSVRSQREQIQKEIEGLGSQQRMQESKLMKLSPETATAWKWIQQNMAHFDHEIFGPPLITCSVKDSRYTDQLESLLQRNDFLTITCQSREDYKKLGDQLWEKMGLGDINFKQQPRPLNHPRYSAPMTKDQMRELGFDAWALELLDGPDIVLAMLCNEYHVHETGIALKDITNEQFQMIERTRIESFVTGRHSYRTSRRREYGPGATSTTTRNTRPARNWTDQPLDRTEKRELEEKSQSLAEQFEAMRTENQELRGKIAALSREKDEVKAEVESLRSRKNDEQRIAGQFAALPQKIAREEDSLGQKLSQGQERNERLLEISIQQDELVLQKVTQALKHKVILDSLRTAHGDLLEAEVRFVEASSDVDALQERNSGIKQQLDGERQAVSRFKEAAKRFKDVATRAKDVCQAILSETTTDYFSTLDNSITMESLQHDIDAERSKLDFIHGGNAGALKEFENRKNMIERLAAKISDTEGKLKMISVKIKDIREKWEPELDKLIKEISDAFSYNFEQIGCAGEVGVHKDEDFDMWSIEIKVKFRENETLQLLDQHRQSGGERSVSTIFYLMSLQSLARAPFRVVDEINQGMDPRNERMVHGRMVEIACTEHTSQYFLITPKLLTGLKYDARMKVLLINSGEYMPEDHTRFTVRNVIATRKAIAASG